MAGLTENDYYKLMKGGNIGNNFSGSHYIIRRDPEEKKNPITKEKVLLNENVAMPNNLNEDYEMKLLSKNFKKIKNPDGQRIDPQLLQYLNRR